MSRSEALPGGLARSANEAASDTKSEILRTTQILVVGGGPSGLTLALELRRRKIDCLVVERSEGLFPGSRGKGLQPRTLEIFHDLGLISEVDDAGCLYPPMLLWEDGKRGRSWRMVEAGTPSETTPWAEPRLIPQSSTQRILLAALRQEAGQVLFGRTVTGLTQDPGGVEAVLDDSSRVRAAYAVAADGGRSSLRRMLGTTMTGGSVDERPLMVADVELRPGAPLDRDHWHVWRDSDDCGLSLCPLPLPGNVFQMLAQFPTADGLPEASARAVTALLAERTQLVESDVAVVRWSSPFTAKAALAERFRVGRVFLVGDAAHIHSPAGGQGLNTSIQDAQNLAWKLAAVVRDGAEERLLDTYEEERLPIAAGVLGLSTRIHTETLAPGGATTVQRGPEVHQLALGYRGCSTAVETRDGLGPDALRAGDRAPDGRPGGERLFDLFRGVHWTLLAVGITEELPQFDPSKVHCHHIPPYEPYGTGVFLIRPDGYVAWAGDDAEGVREFLEPLLGSVSVAR